MVRIAHLLVAAALLVAACGSGDTSALCGPTTREPLDPQSFTHILDLDDAGYRSDPPTSGAHVASPTPQRVSADPLPRPLQVAVLEEGRILVQYRDLDDAGVAAAEALGNDTILVAPNPDLPERVVATGWLTKMQCTDLDPVALTAFAEANANRAPGDD